MERLCVYWCKDSPLGNIKFPTKIFVIVLNEAIPLADERAFISLECVCCIDWIWPWAFSDKLSSELFCGHSNFYHFPPHKFPIFNQFENDRIAEFARNLQSLSSQSFQWEIPESSLSAWKEWLEKEENFPHHHNQCVQNTTTSQSTTQNITPVLIAGGRIRSCFVSFCHLVHAQYDTPQQASIVTVDSLSYTANSSWFSGRQWIFFIFMFFRLTSFFRRIGDENEERKMREWATLFSLMPTNRWRMDWCSIASTFHLIIMNY